MWLSNVLLPQCVVVVISLCYSSGVSLSSKRLLARDYPSAVLPAESSLIKEVAAQTLLSSLLVGKVSVPSFVSDKDVPTSFARFEALELPSSSSNGRATESKTSFMDTLGTVFNTKQKSPSILRPAPIMLLHGFDSSAIEYRRLAPLIALQRDVYIPDILGWGFSNYEDVLSFSPAAKMAHLKSFITEIIGEPCVVVGASLGGAIAILLATEAPELVEKVVLIDAQGFIDGKGPSTLPDFLARFGVNVLKSTPLRMFANYIAYKDKVKEDLYTIPSMRFCTSYLGRDAHRSVALFNGYMGRYLRGIPAERRFLSPSVPLLQQETLLIWGRNDEILEPSTAFKFVEQLPNCKELKWIENCGHVPHLEKPAETADAILSFLGDKV